MAGLFHIRDLMVLLTNNFNNKNIYYDLLQGMSEGQ